MNKPVTIVVLLLAMLTGIGLSLKLVTPSAPSLPQTATVLPQAIPLPEFSLSDSTGAERSREFFLNDWHLVFFGFTHCPDICPTTLATLSRAQRQLAAAGAERIPRIVLVSVDPERDTPEVLERYLDHFGGGHAALTGPEPALRALTEPLHIYFNKVALEDGYTMDHSSVVLLIDPEGRFHSLFSGPHGVESLVHDLPILTR